MRGAHDGPDSGTPRPPAYHRHPVAHQTEPTAACGAIGVDPYTDPVSRATAPPAEHAAPSMDARLGPAVVLLPVQAFAQAKRRLRSALSDPDRIELVRTMSTHVVEACVPLPVAVVCDDEGV